jgi:hypothetical protein
MRPGPEKNILIMRNAQTCIYKGIPQSIRNLQSDIIKFKQALKRFLLTGSFYSLNEYYEWNTRGDLDSYK